MKKEPKINFKCSPQDQALIGQILKRGMDMARDFNVKLDHVTLAMDIVACHCNGTPLKLLQMLMSDPSDFSHDLLGITRFIDRESGKMREGFKPHFADTKH